MFEWTSKLWEGWNDIKSSLCKWIEINKPQNNEVCAAWSGKYNCRTWGLESWDYYRDFAIKFYAVLITVTIILTNKRILSEEYMKNPEMTEELHTLPLLLECKHDMSTTTINLCKEKSIWEEGKHESHSACIRGGVIDGLTDVYLHELSLSSINSYKLFFFCRILFPFRWTNAQTTMNTKLDWERHSGWRRDKLKDIYLVEKMVHCELLNSCCTIARFIAFTIYL